MAYVILRQELGTGARAAFASGILAGHWREPSSRAICGTQLSMRIKNKEIRRRRQRKEQIIKADQRELRAQYGDKKVTGEKAAPKPKAAPAAKKAAAPAAAKPAAPKKAAAPKKKAGAPAE